MLNMIRKNVGIYGANTYILYDESKNAIIIDCGGDADYIKEILDNEGLVCKAILLTHGHFDHIGGVNQLRDLTGAPVYGSIKEEDLFLNAKNNLSETTLLGPVTVKCDYLFKDGDELVFGEIRLKVLETPGHTEGSVCFYNEDMIFTGDTVFCKSVGRTDLYSGNRKHQMESLKKFRETFREKRMVYPGHGPESNSEFEIEHNPYFQDLVQYD